MISELDFFNRNTSDCENCYLVGGLITEALRVSQIISEDLTVFACDWKHVLKNLQRVHYQDQECSRGVS